MNSKLWTTLERSENNCIEITVSGISDFDALAVCEFPHIEVMHDNRIIHATISIAIATDQNGSAIFSAVTVVFLAQLFGTELTTTQQLTLMAICILSGIGTAGIPSGDLPVVAMTLAMFNIPAEGIGLILGVERFLDMCRTTVNVAGDLVVAACIAKSEDGP